MTGRAVHRDRADGPLAAAIMPSAGSATFVVTALLAARILRANPRGTAMKLPRRQFLHLAAGAAALPAASGIARAQQYPARPITMVVPFAAGGPTDTLARLLATHMKGSLGQSVIIENITGAEGSIGVGRVARATPDGYTLSIGHWGTHVVSGAILTLPYHVLEDFEPIAVLAAGPQLVVGKTALPAKDMRELVGWLKANPDRVLAAIAGSGSHIAWAFVQNLTGTRAQFVPYRGAGPALQDIVAGHVDVMCTQALSALPLVRDGKIKAFAVTSNTRLSIASDIPTAEEAGIAGLEMFLLAWPLGAEGDPEHCDRQTECGGRRYVGQSHRATAAAGLGYRKFRRASNRHRKGLPPFTGPRLKNGGPSSRRPGSRRIRRREVRRSAWRRRRRERRQPSTRSSSRRPARAAAAAASTSPKKGCSSCNWPTPAMPPSARPRYQKMNPTSMLKIET